MTTLLAFWITPCGGSVCAVDATDDTVADFESLGSFVVTQLPLATWAERQPEDSVGMLPGDWGDGARIVFVSPHGESRRLTDEFQSAADPDVSFDGERMLFAGRRASGDNWNIFEMNLDGSGVRQITRDAGNCRRPVYQGTLYTLDSTEPWHHIAFVSDLAGELSEQGNAIATSVYSCNLDGSALRRLTMNPSSDIDPTVLPDGRLLFASWQRSTLNRGVRGRVSLFASQSDGIDYALISGDEGQRVKAMPCVTTDRQIVFVESDRVPWDGAGRLAAITLRRNLHSHRPLTEEADGLFHSPSPLRDGWILVSRRPRDGSGSHAVYRLDPQSGRSEAVFDDPQRHDIQARQVAARTQPDGRSTVVSEKNPNGLLYCLNVYENDLKRYGGLAPGSARRLRVLEGIPRRKATDDNVAPPLLPRRFLGEVPIEQDGSFNIELPANIPVALQLVDEKGMALRTCSWIWVRNRESRGCIGCHEDGELTPPNRFVDALRGDSVPLAVSTEQRRTVDFRRDVFPVLDGSCARSGCHGVGGADPRLDGTVGARELYEFLLAPESTPRDPSAGKYVHPGRARTSPLIWHIDGAPSLRPWDSDFRDVPSMASHETRLIDDDARRILVEWIDLGAAWGGLPGDVESALPANAARRGAK